MDGHQASSYDAKGRPVVMRKLNGAEAPYYVGRDAQGFIGQDEDGEFIVVDGEKRYWRSQIEAMPDQLPEAPSDLGIVILKPDALRSGLVAELIAAVIRLRMQVVFERELLFSPSLVYQFYPYFFTPEWEMNLVGYMTSGPSKVLVLRGENAVERLLEFRSSIRARFADRISPIVNLLHCADTAVDVRRELVLLIGRDIFARLVQGV